MIIKPAVRRDQRTWPAITVRGLTKWYAGAPLYDNFDLDIPRNKIMTIFGPNGCGKSTLINMIAGLTSYDGGEVLFDGKTHKETNIGYVFQNYRDALFPWKRAIDNIRYPLAIDRVPRGEIEARVDRIVSAFDIKFDLNRYPYELSGGQQQLVCIMRALVSNPEVLFLDEPFSALDYEMTLFIRDKLQQIFIDTGTTMVLVSHDLEEAVFLADVVLLLTRRPTQVSELIDFTVARPRTVETLSLPEFIETRRHTLEVFQREVNK